MLFPYRPTVAITHISQRFPKVPLQLFEFYLLYIMKYFIAIQTIIYSALFSCAFGQEESWDNYLSSYSGKPGSVLVDLGYIDKAPDKKYPFLVITGPHAQNCGKNGIPDKEEIDQLEEILDATTNFLNGVTAKVLVGTFTYNCERLNYYYVKDTESIRVAIARMYNRSFQNYSYAIHIKADPEWGVYRTFLYPDESTQIWMENEKLITAMLDSGDNLTAERDIKFQIYFRTDTEREALVNYATANGYKTDKINLTTGASYELILSKHGLVKIEDIDAMTADLRRESRKHRGFYNGWTARR